MDAFDLQQHTRAVFVDTRNQTPAEGLCGGLGGGGSLVQGGSGGGSQVRAPSSRQDVVVEGKVRVLCCICVCCILRIFCMCGHVFPCAMRMCTFVCVHMPV